ncbi:hypothetical protein B0H13DRAFT_1905716 [Mycena leptocephala]|nr:hypothetical protein B0H13DRAFT_1905716 [Mycena leptocephala]
MYGEESGCEEETQRRGEDVSAMDATAYKADRFLLQSTPAQIAELAILYPDDPTQGSPFDTGAANQFTYGAIISTVCARRITLFCQAAVQTPRGVPGDYLFVGARRFFLEHASRTQNAWSWLNKRGKSTPLIGAAHISDIGIWFPLANSTDFVPVDALVNFVNTLDPNCSSGTRNTSAVFWPKWNAPSSDGSPSLLTLSDPGVVSVTPENFRIDAIRFLSGLLLKEAKDKASDKRS